MAVGVDESNNVPPVRTVHCKDYHRPKTGGSVMGVFRLNVDFDDTVEELAFLRTSPLPISALASMMTA